MYQNGAFCVQCEPGFNVDMMVMVTIVLVVIVEVVVAVVVEGGVEK